MITNAQYLAEHLQLCRDKKWVVYNPNNILENELPVIYGFNNGGQGGWYEALLMAQDGTVLGSHICSNEGYMEYDLGIIEDARPDRHEEFRKHYPNGYRMEFVCGADVLKHEGLMKAYKLHQETIK
jgi:hypothetical protein